MSARDLIAAQSDALEPVRFQGELIANISAALLAHPSPPCLLRAPTGSGKTFMPARVLHNVNQATPTLWLWFVPFVTLVQQTEDQLSANAADLIPVMLDRGRNQEPQAGMVLLSTAQGVARARDRTKGYNDDDDDEVRSLAQTVALARSRGLRIGLVVDEAHIGLDKGTEFGRFAQWLAADYLLMATATPKDQRLAEFLGHAGKGALMSFNVSRADVVEARLNKRYLEAVVYDLSRSVSTVTDLQRTVLRQAWLRHVELQAQLHAEGVAMTPLLLVQVANGEGTVEAAERDLVGLCKVPPGAIGKHTADKPDPGLMGAIAADSSKQVLIFKQSAGTGFDAPRAFVLASTKSVNDPDFAMQFIGRVMRVAPPTRARFPNPAPIPADLDTAYVYLANADAQRGFESAVQATQAMKSQLEGQVERLHTRQTASGATVLTNRPTEQLPVSYELAADPSDAREAWVEEPQEPQPACSAGPQSNLFAASGAGDGTFDAGNTLMAWDPVIADRTVRRRASLPSDRDALIESLRGRGVRAYLRAEGAPAVLQREQRPLLQEMGEISRRAARALPLGDRLRASAARAALNQLIEKEVHTELTGGVRHEQDVAIVTDRAALAREADAALRRLPQVEEEDVAIIVGELAMRLQPTLIDALDALPAEARPEPKQLQRFARDAAFAVIRRQSQELTELLQTEIALHTTVEDASPLPDAMLFPNELALPASRKNIYRVLPPTSDDLARIPSVLDIDQQALLIDGLHEWQGGQLRTGRFDGASSINNDEREFAEALDRAEFVVWWHRNPDRKHYAVRIVRADHRNFFYPDFIVCIDHADGRPPLPRLIETKEDTKDASRKALRVPKVYGKVLFLTRNEDKFCIVNDDGSRGEVVDFDDLSPVRAWTHSHGA